MTNTRFRNIYLDGHSHFCTASVINRLPLLQDDAVCRMILNVWSRQRNRYRVRFEGYVIMPDHLHNLVRGNGEDVRKFTQYSLAEMSRHINLMLQARASKGDSLAQDYLSVITSRANRTADRKVWKERFRAVPLNMEEPVRVKLEYIHKNPVEAKLVAKPEDWSWSSYGFYSGIYSSELVDIVFQP